MRDSSRNERGSKIYIGRLPSNVSESKIRDIFKKYGQIKKIELKNRFGFVEYYDPSEASDAVKGMDGGEIDQEKVSVEIARGPKSHSAAPQRSDYRVIVDNLSDAVTWQILKDHMKKAGDVAFADVERDHNGRSLGYGIVEFKHYDDMRYAIKNLNDTSLEGKYITVKEDREARSRDRYRSYHDNRRRSPGRRYSPYGGRYNRSPRRSSRYERSPRRHSSHDRSRTPSPRRDSTRRNPPRYDSPRYDSPKHDSSRQDSPRHDSSRHDSSRHDSPRHDSPRDKSPSAHHRNHDNVRRSPSEHWGGSQSPNNENRRSQSGSPPTNDRD
jgi:arginine/serine-rich splicing factor 4/5/6